MSEWAHSRLDSRSGAIARAMHRFIMAGGIQRFRCGSASSMFSRKGVTWLHRHVGPTAPHMTQLGNWMPIYWRRTAD
jgi:hypothetical protein